MLFNIFKVLLHSSLKVVKIIMQVFLKLVQLNFMKMGGGNPGPQSLLKNWSLREEKREKIREEEIKRLRRNFSEKREGISLTSLEIILRSTELCWTHSPNFCSMYA